MKKLLDIANTPVIAMLSLAAFGWLGYYANEQEYGHDQAEIAALNELVVQPLPIVVEPGIDRLFNGLVQVESNGKQNVVSRSGAIGMTQLMPRTAKELGVNPRDAKQNREGGKRYLVKLISRYGDHTLGLIAYNWGMGHTDRWLKKGGVWGKLPKETRDYVSKVHSNAAVASWQVASR